MGISTIIRAGWGLCACAALAGCGAAVEGERASDAPTFVSLNPCLDAILVAVAEPQQILALSHYSRDSAASSMDVAVAEGFAMTGGTAEEVIALQPDIVLASSFIAPATRAALERSGLRVEIFGSPGSVEESATQMRVLAALADHPERGEALVRAITREPARPGKALSALLWQQGEIVAGGQSLVAEQLAWAGFTNHAETLGLGQADRISLEQILADPPDVLLVAGDAPGQNHEIMDGLEGTYIARFDPALFYCAGPSIPKARARLLEIREEAG